MVLNVVLITGDKLNFKVDKSSCVIGRSGQCDVVIPHEAVSRKHCQIDFINGELFVTDLGSINGVSIDGQKIPPNEKVKFQTFFTLSFGAVQSLNVDLPEERTSVQQNPLLATTLQSVEKKAPRPMRPVPSNLPSAKKPLAGDEVEEPLPMTNFIILCVIIVVGFAFFIFREEIMSAFGG